MHSPNEITFGHFQEKKLAPENQITQPHQKYTNKQKHPSNRSDKSKLKIKNLAVDHHDEDAKDQVLFKIHFFRAEQVLSEVQDLKGTKQFLKHRVGAIII
jgi:hypothetical protein